MTAFRKFPIMMWFTEIALKSGLPDKVADDRSEYIFDEGCDYGAECSANDDADSQIEDVTAQNKIPKSLEHVFPPNIFGQ